MDAIQFLKREHETARGAFARIEQAPAPERGALWRRLRPELEIHEQIEEEALYGPLADDAKDRDELLAEWDDEHAQEVEEAGELMAEIDGVDPEDEHWIPRVTALKFALERHIAREEQEVFPRLPLVWDRDRIEQAGRDLERMKGERARLAA
jgi:hemerythrin-like domain-containing protein